MAHETTHQSQHEATPATSFGSSFWFVVILVGLFIGAVNFVSVMGSTEEGHATEGHKTEHGPAVVAPNREATSSQTLEGETGTGKAVDSAASHNTEYGNTSGGH